MVLRGDGTGVDLRRDLCVARVAVGATNAKVRRLRACPEVLNDSRADKFTWPDLMRLILRVTEFF